MQTIKIKDLGEIITGKTPSTKKPELFGNDYPFITPTDILSYDFYFIQNTERGLSKLGYLSQKNKILPPKTVCYVCIGSTIGKICMTKTYSFTNQQINAIIVNQKKYVPEYVYYRLIYETPKIKSIAMGTGSGKAIYNKKFFEEYELQIHKYPIQQKIASILSAYDDLIENNTKRIKILEQMADAIYKEWFVKFRFPGYEKVKFVDSELGKIPEGWEVKTFLEIPYLRLVNENILPYQGTKKYFATADVEGIDFVKDGIEYSYHNKPSRAQKQPVLNSVWFARMKDTYKVLLFSTPNLDLVDSIILSSGFVGFEAISEKWLSFLFISIKSQEFHKQKDIFCTGATQMSLTNEGLARIKWLFPKENIIEEYDKLARPIINSILVYQKQNKILRQIRDILLPKLISGELDVSDLEIKVRETDKEKI